MTLSILSQAHLPPMPTKSVKVGPYRDQAEGFIRRRRELKLSQAAVAELYGGQQGYISDIERGWVNFAGADAEWYERMGRALSMNPEALMRLVGVKFVIASGAPEHSENSVLPKTDAPGYASLVIPVTNSGRVGGSLRDVTVLVESELAVIPSLQGLYLKHVFISVVAQGMLAIYESGADPQPDDVVIIEHQGERHAAYALGAGLVATDTPINARTPAEFQPDMILGVVRRLQNPEQPRRPRFIS